ncbi:MAG: TetR/AcrR family transcriptional regulator [Oligoflexales bacterium]|nr:TetR/AcrR family transcriptional regulator [Oligoflexales bacterium]
MTKSDVATERKNQIVKATVECASKHGYHNFSMQDVAQVAGLSKGIIHYYFLNKDDLMMSVLDYVAGNIEKVLHKNMDLMQDPVKKLEIFIKIILNIVRETREYYQINMDFWTQINQKQEVRHVIATHYNQFRDTCSAVIREGIAKGIFLNVNPREYSSFIIALIDGVSLQWLFDDSVFTDHTKVCEQISSMIFNSLLKPKT